MTDLDTIKLDPAEMKVFRWLVLDGMEASNPVRSPDLAASRAALDGPVRSLPDEGALPFTKDTMRALGQFFDLGRDRNDGVISDRERAPELPPIVEAIEAKILAFGRC